MLIKILLLAGVCLLLMLLWRQIRNRGYAARTRQDGFKQSFPIGPPLTKVSQSSLEPHSNNNIQAIPEVFLNFKLLKIKVSLTSSAIKFSR